MFTDYGGGFYWAGTACRKCMMILSGRSPYNLEDDDFYTNGVPIWAYNCLHYNIIEDVPYTIE
jgi:hypothetical protein